MAANPYIGDSFARFNPYSNERAMREEQERQKYYAMQQYNACAQGYLNQAAAMQNSQSATPPKSEAKRSILLLLPKKGK